MNQAVIQRVLDEAIRRVLNDVADKLERSSDPLAFAMAAGLRPDEPTRRDV
jgi:hypothetical protein